MAYTSKIKFIAALLIIICIALGAYYLGKQDKEGSNGEPTIGFKSYDYRCGDGSEFTLIPSTDKESIHIIPASNIELIPNVVVKSLPAGSRTRYEGGGVSLFIESGTARVTVGEKPDVITCNQIGK